MVGRTPQPSEELRRHLGDQIAFIRKSAAAFDAGDRSEAQRLALHLRILLHEQGRSHALLSQLGLLETLLFDDTSGIKPGPGSLMHIGGLVWMALGAPPRFVAPLERADTVARLPFPEWWHAATLRVPHPVSHGPVDLSREQLVLTVVNQDGGAHVDPALEATYFALTRESLVGEVAIGGRPVKWESNPVPHAIRQIAYETILTLEEHGLAST